MTRKTLIVDDEEGMLEVYQDSLRKIEAVLITLEPSSIQAAELLKTGKFDLLITDLRMPKLSGIDLLKIARENDPQLPVLLITAFPSVDTAIESMKHGAYDYLTKPVDPLVLVSTVRSIFERKSLKEQNELLSRHVEKPFGFEEMIGQSLAMKKKFRNHSKNCAHKYRRNYNG